MRRWPSSINQQRYEVALTFVWADESMDQVVDRLLDQARQMGLRLRRAYLDKGFARREVYALLRQRRLPYLIPIPVKGKSGGIRRYSKGRYGRHGSEWFVYAAYGMDRVPLPQIFELYRRRFGMESGYRQLHQVRARTTSPKPTWRLLLVGLGLLLYNVYIFFRRDGQTTPNLWKTAAPAEVIVGPHETHDTTFPRKEIRLCGTRSPSGPWVKGNGIS